MALTVNSNIPSVNAQTQLLKSQNMLMRSLERLSSGLRINTASDDAAGLAISESLRAQVRGLNQAVRNANDGISVTATAEGSLDEVTSILQRIRELAVQAGNDTNSAANRSSIQAEIDQSLSELTRIADTVQFNGTKLLDGTFANKLLQVGANQNQTISISIEDVRAANLGATAVTTSGAIVDSLASGDLVISGVDVGATSDDEISYLGQNQSAIAIAAAINAVEADSGVGAEVNATTVTGTNSAVQAITLDGDDSSGDAIVINGVNIGAVAVLANDSNDALVDAINTRTAQTGVTASVNSSNQLVLSASDGRNITIKATGSAGGALGLTADTGTQLAGTLADGTTAGTVTLRSSSAFSVSGATGLTALGGMSGGSITVDNSTSVSSIDVTSSSGAAAAIRTVDFALSQVNEVRSDLGALTNRLESTIRNLQTVSENLQASDSRIRDADFAAETAALVKAQILQQTGLAALSQANVMPQAALSLVG